MNDLVSIVVAAYNGSKTIQKCIDSILKQDYKNTEIIVINDGSTDNTKEVLKKYKDKIKLINQKNNGLAITRNVGLKEARGKYLLYVDQDDFIKEDLVSNCLAKIVKEKSDCVIFSYYEIYNSKNKKKYKTKLIDSNTPNRDNLWQYGYVWNKFYKKSIIDKYDLKFLDKIDITDDIIFNSTYFLKINKISFITEPLYYYNKFLYPTLSSDYKENYIEFIEMSINYKVNLVNNYNKDNELKKYLYLFLIRQYVTYNSRLKIKYKEKVSNIKNITNKFYYNFKDYKARKMWEHGYKILIKLKLYNTLYLINTIIYKINMFIKFY